PSGTVIPIGQVFYFALARGLGAARRMGIVEAGFLTHATARLVVYLHHACSPLGNCRRKDRAEAAGSSITRSFQFRSPGSSLTRRRVGVSSLPPSQPCGIGLLDLAPNSRSISTCRTTLPRPLESWLRASSKLERALSRWPPSLSMVVR